MNINISFILQSTFCLWLLSLTWIVQAQGVQPPPPQENSPIVIPDSALDYHPISPAYPPPPELEASQILTPEQLFSYIKKYHPIAQQIDLLTERADATMMMARGGIDPLFYSYFDQKKFDNKAYFNLSESGLKVPTWFGADIKASFTTATGQYVNNENTLPQQGLGTVGITMPLLQGFRIDERRKTLQQAHIFADRANNEQVNLVNKLLYEAVKTYWNWAYAYHQIRIFEEATQIARERLNNVRNSYLQGDKPAIDTLEALIQVQNRQMGLNDARLKFQNSGVALSNFLWYENNTPLELSPNTTPLSMAELRQLLPKPALPNPNFTLQHPQILDYDWQLKDLAVEQRWKAEKLKPKLNVEYNFLARQFNYFETYNDIPTVQNRKWGVDFSFPLFLRSERANLNLTKIKVRETQLKMQQKELEIRNKWQTYWNEWQNNQQQIALYTQTVNNYKSLVAGEQTKFSFGESSLFLINKREEKWIDAQQKLLKLQIEQLKINSSLAWIQATLGR